MQCVYFGDNMPKSFEEQVLFSKEMPYRINIKHFPSEDVVPLHYADSIEILLCDSLRGEIVINANRFPLEGKQLFIIPPYTIHSNSIYPGDGVMYVFKIDFHEIGQYLMLENYLKVCGCQVDQLLYQAPAYDEVFSIVQFLIRHDGDLKYCIPPILELFRILSSYTDPQRSSAIHASFKGSSLQDLITWTNRNYARKITIEEVAKMTGYSKYYFCSHFKALTGMTYMNYLNTVRIARACLMLSQGESVQTVCRSTGFENTSHFIQMFKRIQHVTPHQYACQQKKLMQENKD